jgi:hypothetical protein
MKIVLFSVGLILAATSAQAAKLTFTWDKKEIESLKGKEVYSVYCAPKVEGFTKEACDHVSKSASFKKFKFKTLEWVDNTTIRVGDGPRSVEIKRGARPGSFSMNGKSFDYGTMTQEQVRKKIGAALPRVGRTSLFMNVAYAGMEFEEVVQDLSDAIGLIGAAKTDKERCDIYQKMIWLCEEDAMDKPNTEMVIAAVKNYTEQKTPADQKVAAKKAFAAVENFNNLIEQARDLVSDAHKLQSTCWVRYMGSSYQSEDASHSCTGGLANFKTEFDQKVNQMVLDDAIARTTKKDIKNIQLRFNKVLKQMENFFNKKMDYYDKREIEDAVAEAVK